MTNSVILPSDSLSAIDNPKPFNECCRSNPYVIERFVASVWTFYLHCLLFRGDCQTTVIDLFPFSLLNFLSDLYSIKFHAIVVRDQTVCHNFELKLLGEKSQ